MIPLRPHHMLCMQFFIGKGYSESFVDNMTATIKQLHQQPEITFVNGKDAICRACPNWEEHQCVSQDKVQRYDKRLFELLKLKYDKPYDYLELSDILWKKWDLDEVLSAVCNDCEWLEICLKQCKNIT